MVTPLFFTGLTFSIAYVRQYELLLKSLRRIYPKATVALYMFEPFDASWQKRLCRANHNVRFVDHTAEFSKELGFDTNIIRAIRHCYANAAGETVVSMDADMLVCCAFDELLKNDADVTMTTRGHLSHKLGRQDICFGVSIYSRRNPEAVMAFLLDLEARAMRWHDGDEKPWFEVQTEINRMYLDADGSLLEGYEAKAYESPGHSFRPRVGKYSANGTVVLLKVVDFLDLGCSYPPKFALTKAIHYKRRKKKGKLLYRLYCSKNPWSRGLRYLGLWAKNAEE